jgi:hypothetical protein
MHILVGNPQGKRTLGRLMCRWKDHLAHIVNVEDLNHQEDVSSNGISFTPCTIS